MNWNVNCLENVTAYVFERLINNCELKNQQEKCILSNYESIGSRGVTE